MNFCCGFLTGFFPTKLAGNFQSECPIPVVADNPNFISTDNLFQVPGLQKNVRATHPFHWSFHFLTGSLAGSNSTKPSGQCGESWSRWKYWIFSLQPTFLCKAGKGSIMAVARGVVL